MRIFLALVMAIGLTSPALGQFRYAPIDKVFFSDELQVLLTAEETPGIEKVTGFHRTLAEKGTFNFFRTTGDSRQGLAVKKWDDVKAGKTVTALSLTGQVDLGGKKVNLTETVQAEANGVRFTFQYDPAAVGKDRKGVFILRLPEKIFKNEKFLIDGKEVLSAVNPKSITFGQTPCLDMAMTIQQSAGVRIRRTPGNPWAVELESTPKGKLEFVLIPPAPSLAITLTTDRYRHVFEEDQPVRIQMDIRRAGRVAGDVPITMKTTVTDYYGQTVYQDSGETVLSNGKPFTQTIEPKLTKKGYYVVKTEILDKKYNQPYNGLLTLGVIRPHPLDRPFKPTDYFGLSGISGAYDGGLAATLAKKIGVQWSRDECGWAYREPVKGQYDWRFTDMAVAVTDKLKIGNLFFSEFAPWGMDEKAKWRPPLKDEEAWRKFCRLKAERYKGKGHAWEVTNEPYIGEMPVDSCVKVHQIATEEAHKVDPNTVTLACVSAPWAFDYLKAYLKAGGAKATDAIALHPYVCGGADSPEARDLEGYMKRVRAEIDKYRPGMPIWWTEQAWSADDYDKTDLPEIGEPMRYIISTDRLQASYCVRAHLIGLAEGVRHFAYHAFQAYDDRWLLNMIRPEGIKPIICAYNTMTWMLDGKEFVGQEKIGSDVRGMVFKGPDGYILAYWHAGVPEKTGTVTLSIPPQDSRVIDLMDNREQLDVTQYTICLPIDAGPRFLLSSYNDKALLQAFKAGAVNVKLRK